MVLEVWGQEAGPHPVDNKGPCDEEESRLELLQEDGALALETACQEDDHGSRGEAGAQLGRLGGSSPPQRLLHVICWVESGSL